MKLSFEDKGVETQVIYLSSINFSPCDGCGTDDGCNYREHPCEKDDDMRYVIEAMISADIIIYASPVHAFGICHLMQIFLERAGVGYLRFNRPLANQVGGRVIVDY
ncbi:flavodoxin family protein [Thaumasiovibrio sp. DFM-14]|uniref:flavodoxin family protein n=1 Tax=Thaumasiovibrio sp. DFM-14 TaxID=3384792 RepID=UPI0039A03178